jgi:hypothetical protein
MNWNANFSGLLPYHAALLEARRRHFARNPRERGAGTEI